MKMHVTIDNETYEVEIGDLNTRPVLATIAGETFEVMPEALATATAPVAAQAVATAPPVAPRAAAPTPAAGGNTVNAPIPGVIETIKVHEGEEVKAGQELIILEAMKMKNAIRAPRAGKISRIHVSVGQQVPHNQVLLEFAD